MNNAEFEVNLFIADPQMQLLSKLCKSDLQGFKKLLALTYVDVDHCYDYPYYKTCLDIACSFRGKSEFVEELLSYNANVNVINETYNRAPIHFAVEAGDEETVKELLKANGINVNAMYKGNTPLHLAIKQVEEIEQDRENNIRRYDEIVKCLLKAGSDANIPDMENITPFYSAAKQGLGEMVMLMMKYSQPPIDLDSYADKQKKTVRDMIRELFPHLLHIMPKRNITEDEINISKLFSLISSQEDEFVAVVEKIKNTSEFSEYLKEDNGLYTPLQFACSSGMDKAVSVLLENGADPNFTAPGNDKRPVVLACYGGYHRILKLLTANDSTSLGSVNGTSLLQIVIKSEKVQLKNPNVDYTKCVNILLNRPVSDINFLDAKYNTALHYAVKRSNQATVLKLLKKGAYIGIKNRFDESPLANMSAKTLKAHLDRCLTTNTKQPISKDYELRFDYSFLMPPRNAIIDDPSTVPLINESNTTMSDNDCFLAPETDPLLYMTQHSELQPLLNHPVITSFLYLKWQRISGVFYANIILYMLFWLSILFNILFDGDLVEKTVLTKGLVHPFKKIIWICLLLLLLREILQVAVSPKLYFKIKNNPLQQCLMVIVMVSIHLIATLTFAKDYSTNIDTYRITATLLLCGITISLSSDMLVLLISQYPLLSSKIIILKTVLLILYKFILWYGILIIAFALSFYYLFRTEELEKKEVYKWWQFNPNKATDDIKETDLKYLNLYQSIIKFTVEFITGSINLSQSKSIKSSQLIFMIYVFMILIILLNLLNRLALSDFQSIKTNAELVENISQIQLISYVEGVLFGNLLPYRNAVSKMQNAYSWLPERTCIKSRMFCIELLVRDTCLFPHFLPMAWVGVKANQNLQIQIYTIDRSKKNPDLLLRPFRSHDELHMDKHIVEAARNIINERRVAQDSEYKKMEKRLMACEKKIDKFGSLLERIYNSI